MIQLTETEKNNVVWPENSAHKSYKIGNTYPYFWHISTPHFRFDQELFKGNTISSPGGSIVCLVSPKKSYKLNSLGKKYFSATPFFTFSQKCNRWQ